MEDRNIIKLFFARSEDALRATREKYGQLMGFIAGNILSDRRDAEECVSDVLFKLWNRIPPDDPENFKAYAAAVTRNLALDRLDAQKAARRGSGRTAECLDELAQCLPDKADFTEELALRDALNGFLAGLNLETRQIFMKRYWYMYSVSEIAREMGAGESKVKMSLLRTRNALKSYLEKEELGI